MALHIPCARNEMLSRSDSRSCAARCETLTRRRSTAFPHKGPQRIAFPGLTTTPQALTDFVATLFPLQPSCPMHLGLLSLMLALSDTVDDPPLRATCLLLQIS